MSETFRLNKILAHHGLGSRRTIDEYIQAGRILIDGKKAELGQSISQKSIIQFDGQRIEIEPQRSHENQMLLIYHKPKGQICSKSDRDGRETVYENLPLFEENEGRWISIGRLDYQTSGLLLFTNDGDLGNLLAHPRSEIEREYLVKVRGKYRWNHPCWTKGVMIEPGCLVKPKKAVCLEELPEAYWIKIVLTTGYYRGVRRFFEKIGDSVVKLQRVRFGSITLPNDLSAGQWRYASASEIDEIQALAKKLKD